MATIKSFVFEFGHLEVNQFIFTDDASRQSIMIDAGVFDRSVIEFIEAGALTVTHLLLTHLHPDHVAAVAEYVEAWGCQVISPAALDSAPDARITHPGESIQAGPFAFEVCRTSGHTPESITYVCRPEGVCFVGDAIFAGAVGGTTDDEHHAEEVGLIREHILTLPPETELYSGHGPATTVAIEKAANPFLQPGFTRLP